MNSKHVILLVLLYITACHPDHKVVISSITGTVKLRTAKHHIKDVGVGYRLDPQTIITTGDDSQITLEFLGGKLEVGPLSVLTVNLNKSIPHVSVLGSNVVARAVRKNAYKLLMPFGTIDILNVPMHFIIDATQQSLHMAKGTIAIDRNGQSINVYGGNTYDLSAEPEKQTQHVSSVILLAPDKQAMIQHSGNTTWTKIPSVSYIQHGDRIKTNQESATLQFLTKDRIDFGKNSEVHVGVDQSRPLNDRFNSFELAYGQMDLHAMCQHQKDFYIIKVQNYVLKTICGHAGSSLRLTTSKGGVSQLKVMKGQVSIDNKYEVYAGFENILGSHALQPIDNSYLEVYGNENTFIRTARELTTIKFTTKTKIGNEHLQFQLVEIAPYNQIIYDENLIESHFFAHELPMGMYQFSFVDQQHGQIISQGKVNVINPKSYFDNACDSVHVENEAGVGLYGDCDQSHKLVLNWENWVIADNYEIIGYQASDFQKPAFRKTTKNKQLRIHQESLLPQNYYWYVIAYDQHFHQVAVTGPLTYERKKHNMAFPIRITKPLLSEISTQQVLLKGQCYKDFQLTIDGKKPNRNNNDFSMAFTLSSGQHSITLRAWHDISKKAFLMQYPITVGEAP